MNLLPYVLLVKRASAIERLLAELSAQTAGGTDSKSMAALGGLAGAGLGGITGAVMGGKGNRISGALAGAGIGGAGGALGGAGLAEMNWDKWEDAHPLPDKSFGDYVKDRLRERNGSTYGRGGFIGGGIAGAALPLFGGNRRTMPANLLLQLAGAGAGASAGGLAGSYADYRGGDR